MNKVLVLGCCGGGKSTFSKRLSSRTGLPIIHLDQHFFSPNWKEPSSEDWQQTIIKLCANDQWIMDGNYGGTLDIRMQHADTVIYIDNRTASNLYRVIKRIIKFYGTVRPDMAQGCKERFDLDFLFYVLHFNQMKKPSILKKVQSSFTADQFFILKNDQDKDEFLQQISKGPLS